MKGTQTIRHLYRKSCRVLCTQNYYTSWNNLFWQKTKISGVTYLKIMGNVYSGFIKPCLKGWVPLWVLFLKRRIEIFKVQDFIPVLWEKMEKIYNVSHKEASKPTSSRRPLQLSAEDEPHSAPGLKPTANISSVQKSCLTLMSEYRINFCWGLMFPRLKTEREQTNKLGVLQRSIKYRVQAWTSLHSLNQHSVIVTLWKTSHVLIIVIRIHKADFLERRQSALKNNNSNFLATPQNKQKETQVERKTSSRLVTARYLTNSR